MSDSVFGKKELIFTLLRYITFAIQIIRGFVLASFLGPFFFGIYGYLTLYQQYLSYTNLGINYSVNSELALLDKNEERTQKELVNSAFSVAGIISSFLIFFGILVYNFKVQLFPFQNSYRYVFVLIGLTILTHFQQIFVNIFRIEKKLKEIIIGEIVVSLGLLAIVFFYKGIALVNAIFWVWIVLLFVVVLFYYYSYGKKISFETNRIKVLLKAGFPLLVYAFSYYLMSLIVRTLIGAFYPTIIMGYFSFANNITTAVMLGLNTITWIIFPSVIAKLAIGQLTNNELSDYLVSFTNKLLVLVLLIVIVSIVGLPILFLILPQYKPIEYSLLILLINQIIFNSGFALISLCIARKMYKQMAIISLSSVLISGTISLFCCYNELPYIWLVVSNVIGGFFFINILILYVSRKFNLQQSYIRQSFSWFLQLAFFGAVIGAVLEMYSVVLLILLGVALSKLKVLKEILYRFRLLF
jgi:O-antigen/teichoic acid export membrane protein